MQLKGLIEVVVLLFVPLLISGMKKIAAISTEDYFIEVLIVELAVILYILIHSDKRFQGNEQNRRMIKGNRSQKKHSEKIVKRLKKENVLKLDGFKEFGHQ
jgi:hypothetical protein